MFADQFYKDLQIALIDHDCPQTSSLASTLMVALVSGRRPCTIPSADHQDACKNLPNNGVLATDLADQQHHK